jgi:hypothetical protein
VLSLLPEAISVPPFWRKISSYLLLWRLGCPVLKSVLATERSDLDDLELARRHLGSEQCALRFQYTRPRQAPARGGDLVPLRNDALAALWSDDRLLWLMEPADRLTNDFGINIAHFPRLGQIHIEIVGQYFDVSDINRGDLSPHQRIVLPDADHRGYDGEPWGRASVEIISPEEYGDSVELRREKLARMGINDRDLAFPPQYRPPPLSLLKRIDRLVKPVFAHYRDQEAVISCSVLGDQRLVFWDVSTPAQMIAAMLE